MNTGQVCMAIKRCYVPQTMHDEFVKELTALATAAKFGDGFEKGVEYGPLNNAMQLKIVSDLVEDAKKNGATVNAGGNRMPGDGFFYPSTIISGVKEGFRIVDEEQFGPALPVISYTESEDELIERINDTNF